jgi:lipopolysaccharide assembly protein A
MSYLLWLLKFALFVLILSFAVKNTDLVTVSYYLGYQWQAPLVLVLLVFFCAGVAVGIAAGLSLLFRQRREIAALKRTQQESQPGREQAQLQPPNPPGAA